MSTALSTLVITIERHHKEVQTHGKKTGVACHACGLALIEAKRQVGPGKWIAWVKDNLSFNERQAQNYMKIGRLDAKRISHLDSFAEAYEQAKMDVDMEEYERSQKARRTAARLSEATRSHSMITEKDREEEKRQKEEAKRYAEQTEFMVQMVKAGYRSVSLANHPDTGGSHEAMVNLTEAKDELLALIEEERGLPRLPGAATSSTKPRKNAA